MLVQHIALVPEAGGVSPSELLRVSAALQKQVGSQFGPIWDILATVDAFSEIEDVPAGYRPIVLGLPEEVGPKAGIHLDENGQPYARVVLAPGWSLAASRACLEMLVNPFGQGTISAPSPRSDQGPAEVLVEVCGALGHVPRAYAVNDVPVADFCTPAFYDAPARGTSERYSFRGSVTAPLQLLRGGHLTWFDAISNSWWLRTFYDEHPSDVSLGALRLAAKSVRELVKMHEPGRAVAMLNQESLEARIGLQWLRDQSSAASRASAQRLRGLLVSPLDEAEGRGLSARVESYQSARVGPPPLRRIRAVPSDAREAGVERELQASAERELETEALAAEHERAASLTPVIEEDIEQSINPDVGTARSALRPPARAEYTESVAETRVRSEDIQGLAPEAQTRPPERARDSATSTVTRLSTSVPPLSPRRPSSIAPTAMLDARTRPEGANMGALLTGAVVIGLVLAIWLRNDGSKSTHPPQATRPASTSGATAGAAVEKTGAQGSPATSPEQTGGNGASLPQQSGPPEAPSAAHQKLVSSPANADANSRSKAVGKGDETGQKGRRKPSAGAPRASVTPDDVSSDAPAGAPIETLFDTRR